RRGAPARPVAARIAAAHRPRGGSAAQAGQAGQPVWRGGGRPVAGAGARRVRVHQPVDGADRDPRGAGRAARTHSRAVPGASRTGAGGVIARRSPGGCEVLTVRRTGRSTVAASAGLRAAYRRLPRPPASRADRTLRRPQIRTSPETRVPTVTASRRPAAVAPRRAPRRRYSTPARIAYATACVRLRRLSRSSRPCTMFFTVRSE